MRKGLLLAVLWRDPRVDLHHLQEAFETMKGRENANEKRKKENAKERKGNENLREKKWIEIVKEIAKEKIESVKKSENAKKRENEN